jgi:thiol-disulfide isomerase/thioredoxin
MAMLCLVDYSQIVDYSQVAEVISYSQVDIVVETPTVKPVEVPKRVYVYTADWCGPCLAFKAEPKPSGYEFIFINEANWPSYVYGRKRLPVFHWEYAEDRWTFQDGYFGMSQLTSAISNKPIVRDDSSPLFGEWTFPGKTRGDLIKHLAGPPHNYRLGYLKGLSNSQLLNLHDTWHNKNGEN